MDFDNEVTKLYPWIQRMAYQFCWTTQDAEDLAGETVYRLLLNRDKFDSDRPIKPWCISVMHNTFISGYNRSMLVKFCRYETDFISDSYAYHSLAMRDMFSIIRHAAKLSRCVECVIYCAKGYSYDEISSILHIPVGTVRSRIHLGRNLLSKLLLMHLL